MTTRESDLDPNLDPKQKVHTSLPNETRPHATQEWQTEVTDTRSRKVARPAEQRGGSYLGMALYHEVRQRPTTSFESEGKQVKGSENTPPQWNYLLETTRTNVGETLPPKPPANVSVRNEHYQTSGRVKKDGRLAIMLQETVSTGYIAKALGSAMHRLVAQDDSHDIGKQNEESQQLAMTKTPDIAPPRMNIVIMILGSRGDAQPFLEIGKVLKEQYGHRVRIATHPAFRAFVEDDSDLEFFSVGGDPAELMAYMIKNPGLMPKMKSVKAGDIGRRRAAMAEMFDGFWRACIDATDDETDPHNLKMKGDKAPFLADAIIANPPSFAHVHCAEALGIPLHMMMTFPYTPTQAFPHPLANIRKTNVDPGYTNFISYPLVEMTVWQGLGDLVNAFRVKTLHLDPVSTLWAPCATYRLRVPITYLWSPALIPKPPDWGSEVDVAGFVFLDLASAFEPPSDLKDFLEAGDAPIYIGFGSIEVDDADSFTRMIFKAVEMADVRAVVSKGKTGLGGEHNVPERVFMLENTPHDWLFPRVSACVIHGGAGTTAIALKCGIPTMVVPFFGDQHFWGQMLESSGAGPKPVPYKSLTAEKLADGIRYCMTEEAREAARKHASSIDVEGEAAKNAVNAFHSHLNLSPPNSIRCSVFRDRVATWQPKNSHVKLSSLAADMLVGSGHTSWKRLQLHRHVEWNDFEGPGEPITGVAASITSSVRNAFGGIASVPKRMAKTMKRRARDSAAGQGTEDDKKPPVTNALMISTSQPNRNDPDGLLDTESRPMMVNKAAKEYVSNITSGVRQTASALAGAPVDLSLALAQGFHNAPRLYGDTTVRRPVRIIGIRSGLRAARKEFGHGVYDGFTGIVRLPYRGAKHGGPVGFVKGTGMGLLGFVLKNSAAVIGPVGYTLKGVVKQVGNARSMQPLKYVRRARIVQGQREVSFLEEGERDNMMSQAVKNWTLLEDLRAEVTHGQSRTGIASTLDNFSLDTNILYEDIDLARRALQALQEGGTLEEVMRDVLAQSGGSATQVEIS